MCNMALSEAVGTGKKKKKKGNVLRLNPSIVEV